MSITARHLVKRAPSLRYSAQRSRSPSRPSVDLLAGRCGELLGAGIHLDPRKDPVLGEHLGEGAAVARFLPPSVSS